MQEYALVVNKRAALYSANRIHAMYKAPAYNTLHYKKPTFFKNKNTEKTIYFYHS